MSESGSDFGAHPQARPGAGRTVLVTGAAGLIGRTACTGLNARGWLVRGLDRVPLDGVEGLAYPPVVADVQDAGAVRAAMDGAAAVVHLAGISGEATFPEILAANIDGTYQVFEAARQAGVPRVVYASSNHAVGMTPRTELLGIDVPPRPDTYYGVSKVFGEALGRLYVDRYGLEVVCLRIGTWQPVPTEPRHLSTWLSPADGVRLLHAALTAPDVDFAVVYGISANTRAWWDLAPARALGYLSIDDAEDYAAQVGEPDPADPAEQRVGGPYADPATDAPLAGSPGTPGTTATPGGTAPSGTGDAPTAGAPAGPAGGEAGGRPGGATRFGDAGR
jgi:uronate dehydrogenase